MAEAHLNFVEEDLDTTSDLYHLYNRLYQGMVSANETEPPAFPPSSSFVTKDAEGNDVFDSDGNPVIDTSKVEEVERMAADYSTILIKNSAYLFANSIVSVFTGSGGGSSGSSTGFVSRAGDSMSGALKARYGFEAGCDGDKIFEVHKDTDEKLWAIVTGALKVDGDSYFTGEINAGTGISFDGNRVIYWDSGNGILHIENPYVSVTGDVTVDGTFTLDKVLINSNGVFYDNLEFYHQGNSNKSDVNWQMNNANVYGNLWVQGDFELLGALQALHGFSFGTLGQPMLYSETETLQDENGNPYDAAWITLNSDLKIINGHGIKFDNDYIINVRNNNVVSFSAPGKILNLGDSDNGTPTSKISLQADIWDYSDTYKLISKEGAGYFPNGLSAKCAVSGSSVLETFRNDSDNLGVLFQKQIRFGNTSGPAIYRDETTGNLNLQIPYVNGQIDGHPTEDLNFTTFFAQTTSPFRDLDKNWSATLHFDTDGEFFSFDKPTEAEYFAIKSDRYHTALIENTLFFDDGKFIEGVVDGLRYSGNGYFVGNISSPSFASGFAGYGWAVKTDTTIGGYHATFDSLTVRKKMRVYELEVQKISSTNGSLWVSDSCSGDEVIALTNASTN